MQRWSFRPGRLAELARQCTDETGCDWHQNPGRATGQRAVHRPMRIQAQAVRTQDLVYLHALAGRTHRPPHEQPVAHLKSMANYGLIEMRREKNQVRSVAKVTEFRIVAGVHSVQFQYFRQDEWHCIPHRKKRDPCKIAMQRTTSI